MAGKETRSHLREMTHSMERSEIEMRNAVFRAIVTVSPQRIEKRGRRQVLSTAALLDRILYVCKTGCPWRSLEVQGASPKTVYHHFNRWSKRRVFERAFSDVRSLYLLLPRRPLIADCSFVKNVYGRDVVGRNPTDRGRRATKVSLLADTRGRLCRRASTQETGLIARRCTISSTQGICPGICPAEVQMGPLRRHEELLADKGYDSSLCRSACAAHQLKPLIPRRGTRGDRSQNSLRVRVEHVFGQLDRCRRIILRYEARMPSFRSFHALACAKLISQIMWSPSRPHLLP